MKPVCLGFLLAIYWMPVLSQHSVKPGYIVINGDTARGNLRIDRQRKLTHRVGFQQHGQENFTEYAPSDIASFGYDDGLLYRTISFINKSGPSPVAETLFGQVLVSGKYSLYSLDEDGDIYYVVKNDTATWFLYNDRMDVSGMGTIRGNYRDQLTFFSAGCDALNGGSVAYAEDRLTAFMLRVNQCHEPAVSSREPVLYQNNTFHGYIVKNGDTTRGILRIDRQKILMHRVGFQREGQTNFTEYAPSDIASFGYDDGFLYRTISFINKSGPGPVAETLFGQVLVAGKYSLYSVDEDGNVYYVVKKDTATWFLYNDKLNVSGTEIIRGNYLNQLTFFSAGCDGLNPGKVRYSEEDLTAFMLQVNQCQAPDIVSSSHFVKSHPEVAYFFYAGGLPGGTDWQATLDFSVRMINPRFDRKASLNIGLRYSATGNMNRPHGSILSIFSTLTNGEMTNVPASHRVLSIPVSLQYNFLSGKIQPAVYLGFSAAYLSETPPSIGNEQTFSVAIVAGVCIEAYITSRFFAKADWRCELLVQNPSIGVGFKF